MKCPKCNYLGFETGDRCKNCGYDFSLLAANAFELDAAPDVTLRSEDFNDDAMDVWLRDLDRILPEAASDLALEPIETRIEPSTDVDVVPLPMPDRAPAGQAFDMLDTVDPLEDLPEVIVAPPAELALDRSDDPVPMMDVPGIDEAEPRIQPIEPLMQIAEPALPLFIQDAGDDDTPLITMPSAPRPPLAVRRTPEVPRLRAVSRLRAVEPALDLREEPVDAADEIDGSDTRTAVEPAVLASSVPAHAVAGRRAAAAVIDHIILLTIDVLVVYFTLRMAGLDTSEWRLLPPAPMGIFLGMMAFAYFTAFTAVGGQTIGKMAAGVRVVSDERRRLDGAAAARRTIAALLSYLTAGVGYLPGFIGRDRRTLHDRLARTRVVARLSA